MMAFPLFYIHVSFVKALNQLHNIPAVNQICTQIAGTTDRVRTQALQGHNYRRSRLAQGLVTKNNGNNMPQGGDIRRMQWSCDLETSARESAMRCDTATWPNLPGGVQENIMVFSKSRARYRKDAIVVVSKLAVLLNIGGAKFAKLMVLDGEPFSEPGYKARESSRSPEWHGEVHTCLAVLFIHAVAIDGLPCAITVLEGNIAENAIYNPGTPCSMCPIGTYCGGNKLCVSV
ncbi:hypothetical protein COOONC_16482 [Cooperia oncophora]